MQVTPIKTITLALGLCLSGIALGQETVLTIESWRAEDQAIWDEKIIPVFEAAYPEIDLQFKPTTATEYNAALNARLAGGTAGDIITCRPFDAALALYEAGNLADIKQLSGLENFSDVAKGAWSTDAGALNEDGSYIPMAMGTKDQWEAATMGYTNIGPAYWGGEDGRLGLIGGDAKFTDEPFVEVFRQMEKWTPYLGNGFQAQGYTDSQNLFTLGRAAIYPTGSWEITGFLENADFEMGAFAPPKSADGTCYISDHTDMGIGMNAASENKEAAMSFLEWTTSADFAELLTNAAPGFFSLANHDISVENSLAGEFIAMRGSCEPTIRLAHQILSRGEPALSNQLWTLSANVINGTMTPEDAAAEAQANLDGWYKP